VLLHIDAEGGIVDSTAAGRPPAGVSAACPVPREAAILMRLLARGRITVAAATRSACTVLRPVASRWWRKTRHGPPYALLGGIADTRGGVPVASVIRSHPALWIGLSEWQDKLP
jgi:hypothetical protein